MSLWTAITKRRLADSFLTWLPDHPPVASDFSDEYYRAVASAAALQRASGTALFANGVPSPHVIPVVWTQRIALIFYPNPYRSLQLYHVEGDESSGPIGDMGSHGIVLGKVGHPSVMSRDHAVYWLTVSVITERTRFPMRNMFISAWTRETGSVADLGIVSQLNGSITLITLITPFVGWKVLSVHLPRCR